MELEYVFGNQTIDVLIDSVGKPWFKGNDVGRILGYVRPRNAVSDHVKLKHKKVLRDFEHPVTRIGQHRCSGGAHNEDLTIYINEYGLYSLVLKSKLSEAELFHDWIVEEVLPSIRKTSKYNALDKLSGLFEEQHMVDQNTREGVVYLVTSPVLNAIKIGYWTAAPTGLLKRYSTTYGRSVSIWCFKVSDCRQVEKDMFVHFYHTRIDEQELFSKDHLDEYVEYAESKQSEWFVLQRPTCLGKRTANVDEHPDCRPALGPIVNVHNMNVTINQAASPQPPSEP